MITDITYIVGEDLRDLHERVMTWLKRGWQPFGSVSMLTEHHGATRHCVQTMVKYAPVKYASSGSTL